MTDLCMIGDCGRRVSAAGLCATHRRRRRLHLPMHAPIRTREVSLSDVLEAARAIEEAKDDLEFERLARRLRRVVKRWVTCP